ncbi:hypothetical protein, partial [Escherichia coli]|uniref:hypothetical protein n=1 Tax=Escherichia coli TaxID=562 RepID=UPI00200C39FB
MFTDEGNFLLSHDNRVLEIPLLSNLKTAAGDHLKCYATDVFCINQDQIEFSVNTSWVLKMSSDSNVSTHSHAHSIFTGVIVLDCTPNT